MRLHLLLPLLLLVCLTTSCVPGTGFIGTGTRISTLTPEGIPQVLDLTTGNILWRSAESGILLDSDGTSLLTRRAKDH